MKVPSDRIRKIRRHLDLTGSEVAEKLGISTQYYYNIERGRRNLSAELAIQLADIFNVTLDYLLGKSISAVIENRLGELNLSMKDLEMATGLPQSVIESLDTLPPAPWDYEPGEIIDRIAKALNMDFKTLASAYSRQEPPVYDGPTTSPEECFGNNIDDSSETIAAHHDGEDWTKEELEEIEQFKEFVRMRRKQRNKG